MALDKPFCRTYRPMKFGANSRYSGWAYVLDKQYANRPERYVRAFNLIQKDILKLFEYIEPSVDSLPAYSYRIHELLVRTCIEIEANFKAILFENIFSAKNNKNTRINMETYRKIDQTHHLSSYESCLTIWDGPQRIARPFGPWKTNNSLKWFQAYNASKHDRSEQFKQANLENLLDAASGLAVIISSQFQGHNFSCGSFALTTEDQGDDGMDESIGSIFRAKYPCDWSENEMYDFDWSLLTNETARVNKINYDAI